MGRAQLNEWIDPRLNASQAENPKTVCSSTTECGLERYRRLERPYVNHTKGKDHSN